MEVYAAQAEFMDEVIGLVVDTLKERGQFESSLILFPADNRGCAEECSGTRKSPRIPTRT